MGLRPARCYHKINKKAFTRISTRRPRKSYVKGVPATKIHQFEIGIKKDYPAKFFLKSLEDVQLRSNALEASRVTITKCLAKRIGEENFFFKILVFPQKLSAFFMTTSPSRIERELYGNRSRCRQVLRRHEKELRQTNRTGSKDKKGTENFHGPSA